MFKYLIHLLLLIWVTTSVRADQEAGNSLVVRAGEYGGLYAKSIPAERHGSKGETRVYYAQAETDQLQFTLPWYASQFYLQGTAWGVSVIRCGPWPRGREASDKDLAIEFYLSEKLLKSYSTLDLAGTKNNVMASVSHYNVIKQIKGYRWVRSNDHAFDVLLQDGRLISFDVNTGLIIPPEPTPASP
ncbi:MAG: hypothetical protein ACAH89_07095 [Rariglobus sp.]|nr:hypothetical protein [Rariglobus sp.]